MDIKLQNIPIRKLVKDYRDDGEGGVRGYSGKLDIRPPYQREFVYKPKERDAVIDTITKKFPLNVMYWAVRDDGRYEVIDGQQRTISIAQYVTGKFSFEKRGFYNLTNDLKDEILDYKVMVYFCRGTDSERIEWFKTINIAGKKLTNQEIRNAVYPGPWLSDAKSYFSRRDCAAYGKGKDYVGGSPIRQDYLEKAIRWISNGQIDEYMGEHQHQDNAIELWNYFVNVIDWVESIFTTVRSSYMHPVQWGELYNEHKEKKFDSNEVERTLKSLLTNDEVENKKSRIYEYVITQDEKYLELRTFSDAVKMVVFEEQEGKCVACGKAFAYEQMEGDHIIPWSKHGKTEKDNCQMLCKKCNREKSNR